MSSLDCERERAGVKGTTVLYPYQRQRMGIAFDGVCNGSIVTAQRIARTADRVGWKEYQLRIHIIMYL